MYKLAAPQLSHTVAYSSPLSLEWDYYKAQYSIPMLSHRVLYNSSTQQYNSMYIPVWEACESLNNKTNSKQIATATQLEHNLFLAINVVCSQKTTIVVVVG